MMDQQKKIHLKNCVKRLSKLQISKYVKGQKEHGGQMWRKTGLLNAAMEEVADLANYIPTIEFQVGQAIKALHRQKPDEAQKILEGMLSQKIEMPLD